MLGTQLLGALAFLLLYGHYMRADMSAFDTEGRDYAPAAQHLTRD